MAVTAQELINSTLRLIGVLASGETPSTSESNDAFAALNQMLASWSTQQAPVYQIVIQPVTLSGAESYALSTRPIRIRTAVSFYGGASLQRPVQIVDSNGWSVITDRTRTGAFVESLYYDGGYPTGTVWVSPRPSGGRLDLYCYMPLAQITSLSSTIDLPPGYEHAIRFGLAGILAPEYGIPLSEAITTQIGQATSGIAALNAQVLGSPAPPAPAPAAA